MFSTPPAARDHRRTADEHLTAFYIMQCTFYPFAALLATCSPYFSKRVKSYNGSRTVARTRHTEH